MPAGLDDEQSAQVHRAADLLGGRLFADGYRGVVGVDAMLDPDGGVYPVTEINARNNMSTYQSTLAERLIGPDSFALARHYELKLAAPVPFDRLRDRLSGLLLDRPGGTGLVVNAFATVNTATPAFATVNAAAPVAPDRGGPGDGAGFSGRLYGVVVADTAAQLADLDARIEGAIDAQ